MTLSLASYCYHSRIANWTCGWTCEAEPQISDVSVVYNSTGASCGFVAYDGKYDAVSVVFTGTKPWLIKAVMDDLNFFKTNWPLSCPACKAHRGFVHTYLDVQA